MAKTERVQIRFPEYLKEEITKIAEERDRTEGQVVVDLLERALSVDPSDLHNAVMALDRTVRSLSVRVESIEARLSSFDHDHH
jgi:predicted DNA-binding protein